MRKTLKILLIILVAVVVIIMLFFVLNSFGNPLVKPDSAKASPSETQTAQATLPVSPTPSIAASASVSASPSISASSSASASPSASDSIKTANDIVDYTNNKIEYKYYDVSNDTDNSDTVTLDSDQTLSYPLTLVANKYFGQDLKDTPLSPNSIELNGDTLKIDFSSAITDAEIGSYEESAMLKTIGSIYLQNIASLKYVYITVDGGEYTSGHINIPKDSPFMTYKDVDKVIKNG